MRRYIAVSLLVGFLAASLMVTVHSAGLFSGLAEWLHGLFQAGGFFPGELGIENEWAWLEVTLIVGLAFGTAWCVIDIPQVSHKFLIFMVLLATVAGLSPTLSMYGIFVEPFSSIGSVITSGVMALLYAGTEHGTRKRVLQAVLGHRVSKQTFSRLLNNKERINLEGGVRIATVLTCRMFNHSDLREKMEPADILAMTNKFLKNTAEFLKSRGGYVDESSPDCVRVFFGLLEEEEPHAENACRTALELKTRLMNLNDECENKWFQRLQYGVAISTGPMTVGVYGASSDYYLSAVGSEIDFCRRLSGANTRYHSDVLISAHTYRFLRDRIEVRPIEMLYDPDHNIMTEFYQLLSMSGNFSEPAAKRRDAFWSGVIFYRAGKYEEALEEFSKAKQPGIKDGPLRYFIERTQTRMARDEPEPPENSHELTDQGHARLLNTL